MITSAVVPQKCSSCGGLFSPEDPVRFGEYSVCGACQPPWVQSYRQGMVGDAVTREPHYAGFWIRAAAEVIDILIVITFQFLLSFIFAVISQNPVPQAVRTDVQILSLLADLFYYCVFWINGGATPGKMICGLKVIDQSGGPVRLSQAVKRWFAQFLSGVLLGYGFMKAGWSPEKAALHDGLARTRVIHTR